MLNSGICVCLVTQSCLTLCNPMDCSPPSFSVHGNSLGKNTGVGCHALLQGIFPIQGSNPCLLCRQILYCLSHQRSPCGNMAVIKTISISFHTGTNPLATLSNLKLQTERSIQKACSLDHETRGQDLKWEQVGIRESVTKELHRT